MNEEIIEIAEQGISIISIGLKKKDKNLIDAGIVFCALAAANIKE